MLTESPDLDHAIRRPGLTADWRDFVFLHFALRPGDLAPHLPFPADLHEGTAYVSLVAFRFENLRPAIGAVPARLGRLMLSPISENHALDLRTYVRGPAGPGMFSLTAWVDNPFSLRLGRAAYGLPFRRGRMEGHRIQAGGLRRIAVQDTDSLHLASLVVPEKPDGPARAPVPGSRDAFLLDHSTAYTHRDGIPRCFVARHPRWQAAPFALARFDTTLIEQVYPWFRDAEFVGGHLDRGFSDVEMSAPFRLAASPAVELAGAEHATAATRASR